MKKKIIIFAVISAVLLINLLLGIPRLSKYAAVDEPYWTYDRTSQFWNAVKAGKWSKTDVNDKPGITVAILSGAGLLKYDPMLYKNLRDDPKTEQQLNDISAINFYFRLPIFLFTLAMLPLFFYFLKKLFGGSIALLAFVGIGLSPILLGMSLIINPDSLLWIFIPLSLLSYFVYLKEDRRKFLITSGIFFGLSLLTKYVSNILYVFYILVPFAEYIFSSKPKQAIPFLKKSLFDYVILVIVSVVTFFLLYPATWVDLSMVMRGTFLSQAFESTWPIFVAFFAFILLDVLAIRGKMTTFLLDVLRKYRVFLIYFFAAISIVIFAFVILNTYFDMKFFNFQTIIASPKNNKSLTITLSKFSGNFFADTFSLIFGLTPLFLLGIFFLLIKTFREAKNISRETVIAVYFLLFIFFYYFASSVNKVVATVRYQIVLYPLAIIIGAIGLWHFGNYLKRYWRHSGSVIFAILAASSLFSLFNVRPFFLAYSSSLLPQQYVLNLKGMGDGSYEAAAYLNSLPDSQNMKIWSDKGAVCEAFRGDCLTGYDAKKIKGSTFDYYVVSADRKSKFYVRLNFRQAYDAKDPSYEVLLDGRPANYVKVVDVTTLE